MASGQRPAAHTHTETPAGIRLHALDLGVLASPPRGVCSLCGRHAVELRRNHLQTTNLKTSRCWEKKDGNIPNLKHPSERALCGAGCTATSLTSKKRDAESFLDVRIWTLAVLQSGDELLMSEETSWMSVTERELMSDL